MTDRKSKRSGDSSAADGVRRAARVLADATARVSDQSGRLAGENHDHPTGEDAAHWVAIYTELLSFKAELLEITSKRRLSMSPDARGEAEADEAVIAAQADKYSRRLHEWRAHLNGPSAYGDGTHVPSILIKGQPRRLGHLLIDPWTRTVMSDGQRRQLTQTEWHLLETFVEHPGEVLSRSDLAGAVWSDDADGAAGRVEVSVSRLRRKLQYAPEEPELIETVRGNGYRLRLPLEASEPLV